MTCRSRTTVLAAAALSVGLIASGCSKTAEAPTVASSSSAAAQAPAGTVDIKSVDLTSLVPTPANTRTSKGPDSIADNGIHQYFEVDGEPAEVMDAFKAALESKGWQVSTLSSSGGTEGGGATYTGTHGDAYGVFDGGGYQSNTYIDVCTWPSKPAKSHCQH